MVLCVRYIWSRGKFDMKFQIFVVSGIQKFINDTDGQAFLKNKSVRI